MSDSIRSRAHPTYSLGFCTEFVTKVYQEFGASHFATREQIAQLYNQAEVSVQQKISSCVQYNLLDLKSKVGYKVTDLFKKIYRPETDAAKRAYLLEAFQKPTLYVELIGKFNGDVLPNEKPLSNILFQNYFISDGACERAAQVFHENVIELGLLNSRRELSLTNDAAQKTETGVIVNSKEGQEEEVWEKPNGKGQTDVPDVETLEVNDDGLQFNRNERRTPFNIPLKKRRTAQLIIPESANSADFDTIINWIRLMKESYAE